MIKPISHLLANISQPARLQILLAIGEGEACVCHLETLLGYRQAYISQHLMALRKIGLLDTRREGRYVFYRLQDQKLLDLMRAAGHVAGISPGELDQLISTNPLPQCCCPDCVSKTNNEIMLKEDGLL
ncbi:MAG: metalloregulator ArsR/SmtB family transcription factor [Chloroflexota bacterium]